MFCAHKLDTRKFFVDEIFPFYEMYNIMNFGIQLDHYIIVT